MTWSEATKSPPRGRGFRGGVTWLLHKNKGSEFGTLIFVELAGVEPASKQSAKKLSTRLFFLCLSAAVRGKTPLAAAYPLNLSGT